MSSTTASAVPVPAARRRSRRSLAAQRRWALWGSYAALLVFVFMFLVPPFYTVVTSFKSSGEISAQAGNPWIVHHPTLSNYLELFASSNFQHFFINSVMITVVTVVVSMVISVMAAFGLARMGFWGSSVLATGVFLSYLIPASLLFIPLFQILGALGLINNVLVPGCGVSDARGAVLHLDHDRLLQLDPEGARRGGAHRRGRLHSDPAENLHSRSPCPASSPRPSLPSPSAGARSCIRWRISIRWTRWC